MNLKQTAAVLFFCLSTAVQAGGILDVQDLEMLKIAQAQLDNAKDQLSQLDKHKRILEQSQKMMQGHYQYGSLFDKPELSGWRHSGKDWSILMNLSNSGNTDALTALAKQIEKEFPIKSSESVFGTKNSEQARLFDLLSKTTLASRASNTLAYNNMEEVLLMLEALQKEIEKSPNQKATLDLIARIQIEEAKMTAYKIKADAVNAQFTSLQSQQEVSDAKWASEFFKFH